MQKAILRLWLIIAVLAVGVFAGAVGQLTTMRAAREQHAQLVGELHLLRDQLAAAQALQALPPLTDEEAAEACDVPLLVGAKIGERSGKPHTWGEWQRFRRQWAIDHPDCQWKGCKASGKGMNVHHVWPARWVVAAGHPDLVYSEKQGQHFLTLCREHHALAHNIGYGGSWEIFNPDAVEDAKAGKWNSRGKSVWPFKDEKTAVEWLQAEIK